MPVKEKIPPATFEDITEKRDRDMLGVLFASLQKYKVQKEMAEEQIKKLTPQAVVIMQGYGKKAITFNYKVMTQTDGSSVSYSQANLAKAMMDAKIPSDTIKDILDKARKVTPYTTITMTDVIKKGTGSLEADEVE